jgi:hypothetical protein
VSRLRWSPPRRARPDAVAPIRDATDSEGTSNSLSLFRRGDTTRLPVTGAAFDPVKVFTAVEQWLLSVTNGRCIFVSDNPAYDFQWINYGFHHALGRNPFGHSGRRISDFYAGLVGDFSNSQAWKRLRITPHDHSSGNDTMGNVEAFARLLIGER